MGNLIDRVTFGYVTDFVHVYWKQYSWPDFNVADSAISIGRLPSPPRHARAPTHEHDERAKTDTSSRRPR